MINSDKVELTKEQRLKEVFFASNQGKKTQSNIPKKDVYCKNPNEILRNVIAQNHRFSTIKDRLKIKKVLEKILPQTLMSWFQYAYIRNESLIIYVADHIAQSEYNYQKNNILFHLKSIDAYEKINKISILRDMKKRNKQSLQIDRDEKNERSYGIFDNKILDQDMYLQVEKIRMIITNNRKK